MYARMAFFPDGSRDHYVALRQELAGAPRPAARRVFIAGPSAGGWQVVQVWETWADLESFNRTWFLPALERARGRTFPKPPVVTDFETEECLVT